MNTQANSKEWRANSIMARKEDSKKSLIRADSKEGESTRAECNFWDRPSELTPVEKSQLKQLQNFWTDWSESTRSRQSQLEQSEEVYTIHLSQLEEEGADLKH